MLRLDRKMLEHLRGFSPAFAVCLVVPWLLSKLFWLPDDKRLAGLFVTLVLGAGLFWHAVSGRWERSRDRSLRLAAVWGGSMVLFAMLHVVLDAVFVVKLDQVAPRASGVHAAEPEAPPASPAVDPAFPTGRALRVFSRSPEVLEFIELERSLDETFDEVDLIRRDTSWYWDTVQGADPLRVLGVTLALLLSFLGTGASASLLLGVVAGLASGAGRRSWELAEFPLPEPDEVDVFVSYSHRDTEAVLPLAEGLREAGLKVWIDRWSAPAGAPWPERIEQAIEGARAALVCCGEEAAGEWQRREIRAFHARASDGIALIPVLLPGHGGPDFLPALLRDRTVVDLTAGVDQAGAERIAACVRHGP